MLESLKITPIDVIEIPTNADAWIVSSRNSLQTIKKFISSAPREVFCIGNWMKNEIEKLNAKVSVKSFENMTSLTTDLVKENFREVTYLCGREHRNVLEEGLKNTPTKITKVITYESEMTFPMIKKAFDVVFVFSPRSVESLLKHNFFPQTTFACIGATTADYLHSRGITNTFVPSYPDGGILLKEFYQYTQSRQTAGK